MQKNLLFKSLSPYSQSISCFLQSTVLLSLFLVGSHPHTVLATRLSLHICLCGHAESCRAEQGGGTCKQASPIQTCTTSLQQKFLPWRDFNRIYRVHILKCILGPKQLPTLSELFSNKASNKAYEIQQKSYKNVFYRTPWLMTFTIPFLTVTSLCISKTQYILWNLSQKSPHKIHVIYIGHSTSATLKLEISRFRS